MGRFNVNTTKVVLVTVAAAASAVILALTGSAHVYAYFVMIGAVAPLCKPNRVAAGVLWCGLLAFWWGFAVTPNLVCGAVVAIHAILVECI